MYFGISVDGASLLKLFDRDIGKIQFKIFYWRYFIACMKFICIMAFVIKMIVGYRPNKMQNHQLYRLSVVNSIKYVINCIKLLINHNIGSNNCCLSMCYNFVDPLNELIKVINISLTGLYFLIIASHSREIRESVKDNVVVWYRIVRNLKVKRNEINMILREGLLFLSRLELNCQYSRQY